MDRGAGLTSSSSPKTQGSVGSEQVSPPKLRNHAFDPLAGTMQNMYRTVTEMWSAVMLNRHRLPMVYLVFKHESDFGCFMLLFFQNNYGGKANEQQSQRC